MEGQPKSIWEAILLLLWKKKYGKLVLIILILVIVMFAIWNSLPDSTKEQILLNKKESEKTDEFPKTAKAVDTLVSMKPTGVRDFGKKNCQKTEELFWENLDSEWKQILTNSVNINAMDSQKIYNVIELDLRGYNVRNINPIVEIGLTNIFTIYGNQALKTIAGIKTLQKLHHLDLSNTEITDISELKYLTKLRFLNLENTPINKKQIQKLKKTNPNVEIRF